MPENAAQESHRRRLIDVIRVEMTRTTGRRYERLNLDALDLAGLMDLQRFLRDVDAEHRTAIQRAQFVPWRKP
ncbi:MAG: hypothetical protein K8T90_07480 [Planctomycetes bacterium]|nr:hypothetical protein [Planctomycetota bacterium]